MERKIYTDIQKGLEQTQANLIHWVETTPEEKRLVCCGTEDESCVKEHLHVIASSLEKIENETLGICEICHDMVDDKVLQVDYTATVCLGHFSEAELRQLESELELSQVVQRSLLPQQVPSIEGLNIAAFSRPAQIVSGDYFDFVNFKDGSHGFVVADVSGHGVSAGMQMTSLQMAFQMLVPEMNSPLDVLKRINELYIHNINFTTFVTIFFGKFDSRTRTLTYANAGHNSAYLYRSAMKEEIWLHPTGPAIGLMEGFDTYLSNVRLDEGDILLLYTDGLTEAENSQGTPLGDAGLAEIIRQNTDTTSEQLIQKILQALKSFTNGSPLVDDVTLVVCRAG
jgi:sigma-B regulation protein RsbU (phosphoserine phosphatase)